MSLDVVILAAGQGTRMRSDIPKVLHPVGPYPLIEHVYRLATRLDPAQISVVYGHGGHQVLAAMAHLDVFWVEQKERLGTGHAVQQAAARINPEALVLILYGDVPLLTQETVGRLLAVAAKGPLAVLTVCLDNPEGYGRIVRSATGQVVRIVEERDATAEERAIQEVNTGILAVRGASLLNWLGRLENHNAQGEYYLTDIIGLATTDGVPVEAVVTLNPDEVLGVNDRCQLAVLERSYQAREADRLMRAGVSLRDPSRLDVRGEIRAVGTDVEIDVNVLFEGIIEIGQRVRIGPNVILRDTQIGDDVLILAGSVIEGARIGSGARIGPLARLRPGTVIESGGHVGNFVEIKNSTLGEGSKVNHLSYVGDARVGARANLGAGTITCNYDGVNKHRTDIGEGAFIGSCSQLVAPVTIGEEATIGAGSTITRDAPAGKLTLSRSRQVTIEGWRRPTRSGEA